MATTWMSSWPGSAGVRRFLAGVLATGASLGSLSDSLDAQRSEPVAVGKHYLTPAVEIVSFDLLLNIFDRLILGAEYRSNLTTIRRNLRGGWSVEDDPYVINQLGHPYQGSMYHGFARSAGLNYWEALGYTIAASAMWEIAGEATPPSRNDMIATGIGGTFLGEALYRMASLLLENADGRPGTRRTTAAALLSPTNSFNRGIFGRRHDSLFPSNGAAYYRRFQLGAAGTTEDVRGPATKLRPNEAMLEASMEYGLPGPADYAYSRPFDHFAVQATASSANGFESALIRGLLVGDRHDIRDAYRGVWGLYGSFDYIAPQIFRISSTALSLGTAGQLWISDQIALQTNGMIGAGFAAVGTINGSEDSSSYHYGITPQALAAARLILGNKASIDVTAREYFVSDVPATNTPGHDNIGRVDASLTLRLHRSNAITIKYLWSRRDAFYPEIGRRTQVRGTLGLMYTFLGHDRFGAVDWRER
ncbi:MAG TPA: DUF3943 domain-containing protein [Gemmatimonadaceae bacterium]|jgi:hypothetical protein